MSRKNSKEALKLAQHYGDDVIRTVKRIRKNKKKIKESNMSREELREFILENGELLGEASIIRKLINKAKKYIKKADNKEAAREFIKRGMKNLSDPKARGEKETIKNIAKMIRNRG